MGRVGWFSSTSHRATPARGPNHTGIVAIVRIFSGIQPTGRKHLGNYIGAIRQYVERPGPRRPGDLLHRRPARDDGRRTSRPSCASACYDTTAILLAAGLDPERCILFRQGDVPGAHRAVLAARRVTALGELNRMHQFRDKSAAQRELVSAGLLFYPVLQAADVLAYRADEVPVGEDQREHLELMRDVAARFNARFGEDCSSSPSTASRGRRARARPPGPERKMSTTGGTEQGTVYVLDEPDGDREEVQARGHRLRHARSAAAATSRASRT